MPVFLMLAAALGLFAAGASGSTRAPFLIDMARDLSSTVAIIANLLAVNSIAWGGAAMLAGPASDRWGCRAFLVAGPLGLAIAATGIAMAESLLTVAAWTTFGGFCCGLFTGPTFTEVSHRVGPSHQGRALGWVMTGQSLTLIVGTPLAAWLGAHIGWRGVSLCVAALSVAAAFGFLLTTRRSVRTSAASTSRKPSYRAALTTPVLRLLAMGVTERICYGLVAVYFATFLQITFSLTVDAVAIPLAIFASGNIVGTLAGGQLADRFANRRHIFAFAMLASAAAALVLFGWIATLPLTVGFGFLYVFLNAIARPCLMASLTEVEEHVRGTVMGLSVTCNSLGWMGAAGFGGWVMAEFGFPGFGPLTLVMAVTSAACALAGWRRSR